MIDIVTIALGVILAIFILEYRKPIAYVLWTIFRLTFSLILFGGLGLVMTIYVGQ